ncbi:hypothetical protein ACS0PU_000966 [Formica fusca]
MLTGDTGRQRRRNGGRKQGEERKPNGPRGRDRRRDGKRVLEFGSILASSSPRSATEGRSRPPLAHPPHSAPPSCTSGNLVASGENVSREDNEAGEGGTIRDLPSG